MKDGSELYYRVLILTTSYPRWNSDEAGIFIGHLVRGLSQCQVSGLVLTPKDRTEASRGTEGAFEVIRYPYGFWTTGKLAYGRGILPNLKDNIFLIFQVPALLLGFFVHGYLRRNRYDVIHCQWLISSLPGYLLSITTAKPFIVTIRGEDARLLKIPIVKHIFQFILCRAKNITVVAHHLRESLENSLKFKKKAIVIENGVELTFPESDEIEAVNLMLQRKSIEKFLLFVGRISDVKRTHILPKLLLLNEYRDMHLLLVGRYLESEDATKKLTAEIQRLNLSDRVHIIGPIKQSEVHYLMKKASCYVSASSREGKPNAVLEAIAMRLPLLLSDIPAHRELLEQHGGGDLFSVEKNEGIGKIFTVNVISTNEAKELKNWSNTAQEYVELYK